MVRVGDPARARRSLCAPAHGRRAPWRGLRDHRLGDLDDGQTIANPRWVREELPRLAALQRSRARKKKGSLRFKRLGRRIARLHDRISNLRRDFVHKETTKMVQSFAMLATEQLQPRNMSRSARGTVDAPGRRVQQKAGLNREILSAGFGMAHPMLAYKAEEAGTRLHLSDTRQLKPSQRCSACWAIVPKLLSERMPVCPHCGHVMPRPQQCVSGADRRHRDAKHAWNGRGGETQTSAPATWQVQVCDPRNPRYNAMR